MFVAADGDESKVPENFTGIIVPSEDKRAEALDEDMNEVYKSLRVVLPTARFAKVHEEQMAWLKTRDVAKERAIPTATRAQLTGSPAGQPECKMCMMSPSLTT